MSHPEVWRMTWYALSKAAKAARTRAIAKQAVFEYVEILYNRQRRHSALGYLSPFIYDNGQL